MHLEKIFIRRKDMVRFHSSGHAWNGKGDGNAELFMSLVMYLLTR